MDVVTKFHKRGAHATAPVIHNQATIGISWWSNGIEQKKIDMTFSFFNNEDERQKAAHIIMTDAEAAELANQLLAAVKSKEPK